MEKKNQQEDQQIDNFSLGEYLRECVKKWPWFAVSMAICLGLGALFILTREPVYERSEQVLVKDQDSGAGMADVADAFSSFGLVTSKTSVNNELISLTSPAIMYEVIKKLGINYNYTTRKGLHPATLYGNNLPLIIDMIDLGEQQSGEIKMELHPDGSITMKKFIQYTDEGKEKTSLDVEVKAGQTEVETPIGRVRVLPNPRYTGGALKEDMTVKVSKMAMQSAVELYGKRLLGDLVDMDADVIELTVKDPSVQKAVEMLNEILNVYNTNWVEDKNKLAVATSAFIDERLRVIQQELGDVDSSIARQTEASGTPNLQATATLSLEKSEELNARILELNNQLAVAQYMKEFMANKQNVNSVIPVNTGMGSESVDQEISEYNKTLLQRNNLEENSSAANPLVQDMDRNLAGLRTAITNGIDAQIRNLQTQIGQTGSELGKTQGKMMNTPRQALPLLTEERQQKVKESLYLFLLQKREENQLTQKFTADNLRVITPPMGSLKPVSPKKEMIMILAFLMGLAIPVTIIYVQKCNDTKVRSRKDLEDVKMPFAGEIPQVGKRKKAEPAKGRHKKEEAPLAIVEPGKRDVANEAFRVVRGNLDFMAGKGAGCKVVMFTSFNPGSGKSFIAYNLSVSYSLRGKKVLLIDCDLRHGSASMYVGSPSHGLTDWLTEDSNDWKRLTVAVPWKEGVDIIPTGKMPPNPAELLENGRLATLIEEAKKDYDIIFLDCPPVNIVVDTQIVSEMADTTVFVVRAGLLELSAVKELNEFYAEKKFHNMCLILNGTDTVHSRYYTYGNYQNHNE